MEKKVIKKAIVLAVGGLVFAGVSVAALAGDDNGYSLVTQPSKCISLNRGLVCYQKVHMQWIAPEPGDYCVVQAQSGVARKCWSRQQSGSLAFEFAETDSRVYALRRRNSDENLATVQIEVKWVYKRRRKDHFGWKVF